MLWLEELIEAYADEYRSESKTRRKNARRPGDYKNRLARLYTALKRSKERQMTTRHLEDYHRQVKNLSYFAFRSQDAAVIAQICGQILPELVRLDLALFLPGQKNELSRDFLDYMKTEQSGGICSRPLLELYQAYRHYVIQYKIMDLVPSRPEMEFPETMAMNRRFILHVGPTNTGKTVPALERLEEASWT